MAPCILVPSAVWEQIYLPSKLAVGCQTQVAGQYVCAWAGGRAGGWLGVQGSQHECMCPGLMHKHKGLFLEFSNFPQHMGQRAPQLKRFILWYVPSWTINTCSILQCFVRAGISIYHFFSISCDSLCLLAFKKNVHFHIFFLAQTALPTSSWLTVPKKCWTQQINPTRAVGTRPSSATIQKCVSDNSFHPKKKYTPCASCIPNRMIWREVI